MMVKIIFKFLLIVMVKFALLAIIVQKMCLIVHLFVLMSSEERTKYDELQEEYPSDGLNDNFTGAAFLVILQYLIGIALLFVSFCMEHKKVRFSSYIIPWLCTLGLMLELPINPVLPSNLIQVMFGFLLLQVYMVLCVQACHTLITASCLAISSAYLVYYGVDRFGLEFEW